MKEKKFIKLTPFKMQVLQSFPFIDEDFDAITNYELLCKVVEYLNKTVENVDYLNDTVNDYIDKFNELKSYVDNYFDNLDVQEEINNKLDEMAESGELTDIIAQYLGLAGMIVFDNVSSMKTAENLVNGSKCETLGFYSYGDGGSAKYRIRTITNQDTIDEVTIIALYDNSLVAELILEDEMNIIQFGCYSDGVTNSTTNFNIALNKCKTLIIPDGTFLINRFLPLEGQTIRGTGNSIINLNGTTAPLAQLPSNFTMINVKLNSINENLAWNRCNIQSCNNIILDSCSFEGFRHNSEAPNAWGLIIRDTSNVMIKNCYFNNNSQSDIAMVLNTKNINIENCSGSSLHINIEPQSSDGTIENIKINNCDINLLNVLENSYTGTATKSLSVSDCTINMLQYDGGVAEFNNCQINDIINQITSNVLYAGNVTFNNCFSFSGNLIDDPYIDNFEYTRTSTQPWYLGYTTASKANASISLKNENGVLLRLNPNEENTVVQIKHQNIPVEPTSKYLIKLTGRGIYPTGSTFVSLNLAIYWYDSENTEVRRDAISTFRSQANSSSNFGSVSAILVPPTNASYMVITILNCSSTTGATSGVNGVEIRSVELYKINNKNNLPNNLIELPVRNHREFTNSSVPTNNFNYYLIGDKVEFTNPSSLGYIGCVATANGYGNDATWKKYGSLES